MSRQYRKTRKDPKSSRYNISSDIKLFLVLLAVSICGLSVFIFWSDIKNYTATKYENKSPSNTSEGLIFEEADLYSNTGDKPVTETDRNAESSARDKYEKKDKDYLEKLIHKH